MDAKARDLGEQGLAEAMERLRARMTMDAFDVPFTEVLWWIVALKDLHGNGIDYRSEEGRTIRALGFARNYASHDLLTLANQDFGRSGFSGASFTGFGMQGSGAVLVWTDESRLGPSKWEQMPRNVGKVDPKRPVYQSLVAGRYVLGPLEMAQTYLTGLP
jgi:hypothetical protein